MSPITLTIRNYRCFFSEPVKLHIRQGTTAFIGPNNAGKSVLLRFFYEFKTLFRHFVTSLDEITISARQAVYSPNASSNSFVGHALFPQLHDGITEFSIEVEGSGQLDKMEVKLDRALRYEIDFFRSGERLPGLGSANESAYRFSRVGQSWHTVQHSQSIDCTTLVHAIQILANSFYVGSFRNSLNSAAETSYFDLEVGREFIRLWDEMQTGQDQQANRDIVAICKLVRDVFQLPSLTVNANPTKDGMKIMIEDRAHSLDEVGTGLSHFLIVLAQVARNRPALLLIDEPELGLHPSLQLAFLQCVSRYVANAVLFSTHSLGLARSTAGSAIYAVNAINGHHRVRLMQHQPTLAEFMGQMSYGGYVEMGFRHVLLVEGVTDVAVFQNLLRRVGCDHKCLIISLGGSSLINGNNNVRTQLEEIRRIVGIDDSVSVVIDRDPDRNSTEIPRNRVAFKSMCETDLNFFVHILDRRATENYWTAAALASAGIKCAPLGEFERLSDRPQPDRWDKSDNNKISLGMKEEELRLTDLGPLLLQLKARIEASSSLGSH